MKNNLILNLSKFESEIKFAKIILKERVVSLAVFK